MPVHAVEVSSVATCRSVCQPSPQYAPWHDALGNMPWQNAGYWEVGGNGGRVADDAAPPARRGSWPGCARTAGMTIREAAGGAGAGTRRSSPAWRACSGASSSATSAGCSTSTGVSRRGAARGAVRAGPAGQAARLVAGLRRRHAERVRARWSGSRPRRPDIRTYQPELVAGPASDRRTTTLGRRSGARRPADAADRARPAGRGPHDPPADPRPGGPAAGPRGAQRGRGAASSSAAGTTMRAQLRQTRQRTGTAVDRDGPGAAVHGG